MCHHRTSRAEVLAHVPTETRFIERDKPTLTARESDRSAAPAAVASPAPIPESATPRLKAAIAASALGSPYPGSTLVPRPVADPETLWERIVVIEDELVEAGQEGAAAHARD